MSKVSALPFWWKILFVVGVPTLCFITQVINKLAGPVLSELSAMAVLGSLTLYVFFIDLRNRGFSKISSTMSKDFWLYLALAVWAFGLSLTYVVWFGTPFVSLLGLYILLTPLIMFFFDDSIISGCSGLFEWAMLLLLIATSLFSIFQFTTEVTGRENLSYEVFLHGSNPGRTNGLSRSTLGFSGLLGCVLPFVIGIRSTDRRFSFLKATALILGGVAAIQTQSRALWGAFGLALIIATVFNLRNIMVYLKEHAIRAIITALSCFVVIAIMVFLMSHVLPNFLSHQWERLLSSTNFANDAGNQMRANGYSTGINAILHRPWGSGVGHTATAATYFIPPNFTILNFESFELELVYAIGLLGLLYFWPFVRNLPCLVRGRNISNYSLSVLVITVLIQNLVAGSMTTPVTLIMTFLCLRFAMIRAKNTNP
jgi:hypothetical protein